LNLRFSLILIIVSSWVAVAAVFAIGTDFGKESNEAEPPFFYNIPVEDLVKIQIEAGDNSVSFHYREESNRWFFDETDEYIEVPTDTDRWGGITTLLGGPRTQRMLSDHIDNPATYGLDDPASRYTFTLRDGSTRSILIGNHTVDQSSTYAKVEDRDILVTVDSTWAAVLDRLATEPPVPEWMFQLDPGQVREALLFVDNEIIRGYGIDRDTQEFHLCTLPIEDDPCAGETPVSKDAFLAAMASIADRKLQGAVALDLQNEEDFAPFGAGKNSPYIAIRIEQKTQTNVTEVTRVTMTIGDVTPDGKSRYAVANESSDVIRVDKEWADEILELFYGEPIS
jgi:hypothetical protein